MNVDIIIPALDEEDSVGAVVRSFLALPRVREILVVDNGSSDRTAEVAAEAGARVIREPRRGYGSACLAAIAALKRDNDVVVFVDADASDDPADFVALIAPIVADHADLVIGSRVLGNAEPGAFSPQQRIGSRIAGAWLRLRFGLPATDLGPFRAVRRSVLDSLRMADLTYGWTVEMQIKAAQQGVRYVEIPVAYRNRRAGKSKVSGTLRGVAGATMKILGLLAYHDVVLNVPMTKRALNAVTRVREFF
ncbi:MAG: glycosyltransferase family 2 protein [Clostridia bacterium]|nr:glycosyltransferase family 2 protein [Deltaproteobacteria bacterium]